jgi:hypothetical protein
MNSDQAFPHDDKRCVAQRRTFLQHTANNPEQFHGKHMVRLHGVLDSNSSSYSMPRKIGKSISKILLLIFLGNTSTINSTTTKYRQRKSKKLKSDETTLGRNVKCIRVPLSESIGAGR